ncbi:hypothetical protein [uncultured Olleya sp.]|uniref:arsenate reductase family protein n=1 Tax=uncultured Olleya sp. TaxID=757243 RepID=UPI0025913222|nr:hypothetical protein [uncultured Olleya sp.]
MGIIATNNNKTTFYYNSNSNLDKQTLAYVTDSLKKLSTIDFSKTKVADTQWIEICDKLNISVADLVNKQHPDYTNNYNSDNNLNNEDWLKVIQKSPQVVAFSILVIGDKFYKIENPSEARQYLEGSSNAIDDKKHI